MRDERQQAQRNPGCTAMRAPFYAFHAGPSVLENVVV